MKIALILAMALATVGGCKSPAPVANSPTIATATVDVERMVRAVPLVFYEGSAGAGVLFKTAGKVGMITAAHVIADGDPEKQIPKTYGQKIIHIIGYRPGTEEIQYSTTAKIVAFDPVEDWAVLQIEEEKQGMEFVDFADTLPHIGQPVWMIGSPLLDAGTVSRGVVCHPFRSVNITPTEKIHFIHTDAVGMNGSSGGGLFSENGCCIGIIVRRNALNGTMYAFPTFLIHEHICSMFLPPDPMPIFVE
jgi:S1-C subfamily serine protease